MRHATPRRIQWSAWMADGMAMSMTKLVLCPVVHNVGEGATKIEESERESVRAREKDLQKLVPYYIYYRTNYSSEFMPVVDNVPLRSDVL